MAFSPFHWFRKHQKVFFAGLTVLCMLVFIGQAGYGADIFQTILRWLGADKHSGEKLSTLNGKKVTTTDVENVRRKRQMANDFLTMIALRYHPRAIEELSKDKVTADNPGNPLSGLREVIDQVTRRRGILPYIQDPRQLQQFFGGQIDENLRRLEDIARREKVKDDPDRLQILQNVATVVGFDAWLARRAFTGEEFYFGGSRLPDDLLDFMVWQHQADKLGITLTDADLVRELRREAAGQEVFDEKTKNLEREKLILDSIRNRDYGPTTPRDLVEALREEFRVVMAQGLLIGAERGARSYRRIFGATTVPAVGTPDQFLRYYREQRTTLHVKMLPVPVSAFLSKVTSQPSEKELLNRYNEGREREPSPNSREPAFKEPRRIAVEYASASPDDPFYRDVAQKQAQVWKKYADPRTRAASTFGLLAGTAVTGPFAVPVIALDPYQAEYETYLRDQPPWVSDPFGDTFSQPDRLHTSSVLQPTNIAAMFGSLSASVQGGKNPFAAPATLYASATHHQVRESLKVNLAMLLARSTSPGSSFSDRGAYPQSPLTALMLTMPMVPKPLPMATLEPQLMAALEKRIADSAVQENLEKLRSELAKLKGKDTATIRAVIDKAVKEFHLTLQAMPKPLPANVMIDELNRKVDLGIRSLKEAYLARMTLHKVEDFVATLFSRSGVFDAQPLPGRRESNQRDFLFWRTEDKPARTRPFRDVRAEVEAAWRFEEARKLARREAERLEAEVNSKKWSPADAERFLREQNLGEIFELNNIAQLVPPTREVHEKRVTEYVPYSIPPDHINQLTYPPAEMVKHLLTLKRPGEATVIADQPAKNFFVAVLFDRDEPTVKQFESVYRKPTTEAMIYNLFTQTEREEYYRSVMKQLRTEAGKVDKDGRYVLPESYRKRSEGGGRAEEE
jgi:hypothetical protein